MLKMGNNDKNKIIVINNGYLFIFLCFCRVSRMLILFRVVVLMFIFVLLSLFIIFIVYGFLVILWIYFRIILEIFLLVIKNMFNLYMRIFRNIGKCMGMYRYRIYF